MAKMAWMSEVQVAEDKITLRGMEDHYSVLQSDRFLEAGSPGLRDLLLYSRELSFVAPLAQWSRYKDHTIPISGPFDGPPLRLSCLAVAVLAIAVPAVVASCHALLRSFPSLPCQLSMFPSTPDWTGSTPQTSPDFDIWRSIQAQSNTTTGLYNATQASCARF